MDIQATSPIWLGPPTAHTSRPPAQTEKSTSGKQKIKPSSPRNFLPPPNTISNIDRRYTAFNVMALAWHPFSNTLSFTTSQGQLYRWKDCIPNSYSASYGPTKRAPTLNGNINTDSTETSVSRSPSILSRPDVDVDPFGEDEDDDFIIDDDGAGYVPLHSRKRGAEWDDAPYSKRGRGDVGTMSFRVKTHEPFQSGSTPWRGNRRYLSNKLSLFSGWGGLMG